MPLERLKDVVGRDENVFINRTDGDQILSVAKETPTVPTLGAISPTSVSTGAVSGTTGNFTGLTTTVGLSMASKSPASHAINLEGLTLASNCNAIRGASINPTRTSGWISFSGTVAATPAQVYTDYRNLTTTGAAEVLGIGSFPMMATGSSCASMFALQAICQVDSGATVLTASGAPAVGIFPIFAKCLIDGATFNSGGVAACAFMAFQANTTDVQAGDTSIINAEVASGGIQNVLKFQCSAAKGATYLFNFTDDNGEPASNSNGTDLADISATANAGWIKVLVGSTIKYIPLYAVKAE